VHHEWCRVFGRHIVRKTMRSSSQNCVHANNTTQRRLRELGRECTTLATLMARKSCGLAACGPRRIGNCWLTIMAGNSDGPCRLVASMPGALPRIRNRRRLKQMKSCARRSKGSERSIPRSMAIRYIRMSPEGRRLWVAHPDSGGALSLVRHVWRADVGSIPAEPTAA